jgi:lipopolysaccharide biosynthesis glycosyltransferase
MIPLLIPQYSKIIYSDTDIIFQRGLSDIYNEDITNYYLAAVFSGNAIVYNKTYNQYVRDLNLDPYTYVQAGFLLINSAEMIKNDICSEFKLYSSRKFLFQDQDIINIVCKGKIKFLPLRYNYTQSSFFLLFSNKPLLLSRFSENEINDASKGAIIHYEGTDKPWNSYCFRYDIWWEYYRKSLFFDAQFYFDSNNSLLNNNSNNNNNYTFQDLVKMISTHCKTTVKRIIRGH